MILLMMSILFFDAEVLWSKANQAYKTGDFVAAITQYEQLIGDGVRSGKVHYNLGNAYFKNGQLGPALLNYYRAEQFIPGDEDIRHNIAMANQQRRDPVIEAEREGLGTAVDLFFFGLSYRGVFYAALICLVLAGLAGLPLALGRRKRVWGYTTVLGLIFGVIFSMITVFQYQRLTIKDEAVVMATQVDVLAGPAPSEAVNFTLHEGIRCQVLESQPGWFRIRLANGYNGWLPQSDVEKI